MHKFKCSVCGYVYDSNRGDPFASVEPQTPFEDLPEDWICPICQAEQTQFHRDEAPCMR